jgi:hypothetical protein
LGGALLDAETAGRGSTLPGRQSARVWRINGWMHCLVDSFYRSDITITQDLARGADASLKIPHLEIKVENALFLDFDNAVLKTNSADMIGEKKLTTQARYLCFLDL